MASMKFTAGRLLCGKIRDFLNECKFEGMHIDYVESSGLIERDFLIKGSDKDILTVSRALKNWADNLSG